VSRLILVRHGNTKLNSAQRYWGKTDVLLSSSGLRQAEKLRARLAREKLSTVYSSCLKRALLTAQIIASKHKLEVTPCPELNEIDFGKVEGLTFAQACDLYPEVTRLWVERSPELEYPEGESVRHFRQRIQDFISNRLQRHSPRETVLIVAHSGVLRTLICYLLGLDFSTISKIRTDLASISIVETYDQVAILNRLNDTSHLKEEA